MKKTLVALAIAGAYTGVAYAQSTVTLYGLIDTYVEAAKTNGDSVTKVSAGGLNGPRWGLTGAEDLGGGLKAVFTLEGGYNSDTGTIGQGGRIFGRQMFVGLAGGFGQFLMTAIQSSPSPATASR
jgi:predicted porin